MPRIPRPPAPHPRPPRPVRPVRPVKPVTPGIVHSISQLPVFRLIVGSSVGVAILNWWNTGTSVISDTLGVDERTSAFILGCGIAVCLAIAIAAVLSAVKNRKEVNA